MRILNYSALLFAFLLAGCGDPAPGKVERSPEKSVRKNISATAPLEAALQGRTKNLQQASINNLKQIGVAIMMFAMDNRERFPESLKDLVSKSYLTDCRCYISPFDKKSVAGSAADFDPVKNCSYAYFGMGVVAGNFGSGVPIAIEKPWCLPENSNSIAVLYADGSAKIVQIPNVNKKSCLEVVEIILKGTQKGSAGESILKNAGTADSLR